MTNFIRRRVSQNRYRYHSGNYDLDLTYITPNLIAMGYPSDTVAQGLIRNRIETVSKFLKEEHPNSYKVYNLCIESNYDLNYFENNVETFPMEDHNPPNFLLIEKFCKSVQSWLSLATNKNVAAVHCKAGKGRTGTMISCFFIYSGAFLDPFEAMDHFSSMRCKDSKGVTIPSQRRYIEYFADVINNKRIYQSGTVLNLKLIKINVPIKQTDDFVKNLKLIVSQGKFSKIFESIKTKINRENSSFLFDFKEALNLEDDIKFSFYDKNKVLLFAVVFNTFCFIQRNNYCSNIKSCQGSKYIENEQICWRLTKKDLDIAFKNRCFDSEFTVKFYFIPSNDLLVHNVLNGPVSLTSIKEEEFEKTEAKLNGQSQKVSQNSAADRHANKIDETPTEKLISTRTSTKSKMSQKKGVFSFLFKKSKSLPSLNGIDVKENGK